MIGLIHTIVTLKSEIHTLYDALLADLARRIAIAEAAGELGVAEGQPVVEGAAVEVPGDSGVLV